jgi:hypothetical protein
MAISYIKDMDKETVLRVLLTMLEISYHSQKRGEGYSAGLFLRYAHETALLSPVCPPNLKAIINKAFVSMKERRFKETAMYVSLAYQAILRYDGGRAPLPIDDYDLQEGGVYFPGGDDEVNENKFKTIIDSFIIESIIKEADYMDNANPNNNASDQGTITPPDVDAQTQEIPDEKNPENKPEDEEEEPEETEEEPEEKSEVRLLIIDKIPCNRQLKELTKDPMADFPLTAVEAALDEINIAIEPGEKEGLTFVGADGNVDLELIEKSSGKFINNSFLIVYWSTIEGSTNFNFNCYLG